MIGSSVLLCPDTGQNFLRCLKSAVLYAEQINVLTVLDFDFAEKLCEQKPESIQRQITETTGAVLRNTFLADRILDYFKFVKSKKSDLQLLINEGLLNTLTTSYQAVYTDDKISLEFSYPGNNETIAKVMDVWLQGIEGNEESVHARLCDLALHSLKFCPPSFFDLEALDILRELEHERPNFYLELKKLITSKPWLYLVPVMMYYCARLTACAEQAGSCLLTWSKPWQETIWSFREYFASTTSNSIELLNRRSSVEAKLGHTVLDRYIPSMEDFEFEEIIRLRKFRAPELEAFRVSVAELATQIDIDSPLDNSEIQIQDLVKSKVDPAIRDLKAALDISRMDSFVKVGKSWKSIASGLIAASLSFAAGTPLDVSAILGAGSMIAGPLLEGVLEHRKLQRASQWSFLLRLPKSKKHRRA